MNAVGCCGLQLYHFGETVSIPFWTETWKPNSFVEKIDSNLRSGLHTLCLLGRQEGGAGVERREGWGERGGRGGGREVWLHERRVFYKHVCLVSCAQSLCSYAMKGVIQVHIGWTSFKLKCTEESAIATSSIILPYDNNARKVISKCYTCNQSSKLIPGNRCQTLKPSKTYPEI